MAPKVPGEKEVVGKGYKEKEGRRGVKLQILLFFVLFFVEHYFNKSIILCSHSFSEIIGQEGFSLTQVQELFIALEFFPTKKRKLVEGQFILKHEPNLLRPAMQGMLSN